MDRKEMNKFGADPAAAMAIAMSNGAVVESGSKGNRLTKSVTLKVNHGYSPTLKEMQTGVIIVGAGVKKPSSIKVMESREITPLVATILNIPFGIKSKIAKKVLTNTSKKCK